MQFSIIRKSMSIIYEEFKCQRLPGKQCSGLIFFRLHKYVQTFLSFSWCSWIILFYHMYLNCYYHKQSNKKSIYVIFGTISLEVEFTPLSSIHKPHYLLFPHASPGSTQRVEKLNKTSLRIFQKSGLGHVIVPHHKPLRNLWTTMPNY